MKQFFTIFKYELKNFFKNKKIPTKNCGNFYVNFLIFFIGFYTDFLLQKEADLLQKFFH